MAQSFVPILTFSWWICWEQKWPLSWFTRFVGWKCFSHKKHCLFRKRLIYVVSCMHCIRRLF